MPSRNTAVDAKAKEQGAAHVRMAPQISRVLARGEPAPRPILASSGLQPARSISLNPAHAP